MQRLCQWESCSTCHSSPTCKGFSAGACLADAGCHRTTELARVTSGNLLLVAHVLGHANVTTTQGYTAWACGPEAAAVARMWAEQPLTAGAGAVIVGA